MTARAAFTQADLHRMIRAAQKAGVPVMGYELRPDGAFRILTAKPGQALPAVGEDANPWDEVLPGAA